MESTKEGISSVLLFPLFLPQFASIVSAISRLIPALCSTAGLTSGAGDELSVGNHDYKTPPSLPEIITSFTDDHQGKRSHQVLIKRHNQASLSKLT